MPPGYGSIDASNQSKDSQENGEKREEQLQNLFDGTKTEISLEEALENAGFGSTQVICLLGLAVVITGVYGQLEAINLLGPELLCEWKMTGAQEATVTASLFAGSALGSVIGGKVSDKLGRRITLMACCFFTFILLMLSIFAKDYISFSICIFTMGLFYGPLHLCYTYATELVSTKHRSTAVLFLFSAQSVGAFFATSMGLLVIPNEKLGWQIYQAVVSIPFFLGFVILAVLPETPRFFITSGKPKEALEVIQCLNPAKNLLVKLKPVASVNRGSFREIFKDLENVKSLLALLVSTSMIRMAKAAVGLLFVESLQIPEAEDGCILVSGNHDVQIRCERLKYEDYGLVVILACSYVIAALLSKPMADFFGRRKSLLLLGAISVVQLSMFFFCKPDLLQTFLALSCRSILSASLMVSYLFINESFPTSTRALSFGIVLFSTDVAIVTAPVIVQFLSKISYPAAVLLLVFASVVWTITMIIFRKETKDKPQSDSNEQIVPSQSEQSFLKNDRIQ